MMDGVVHGCGRLAVGDDDSIVGGVQQQPGSPRSSHVVNVEFRPAYDFPPKHSDG